VRKNQGGGKKTKTKKKQQKTQQAHSHKKINKKNETPGQHCAKKNTLRSAR
jgi:hypothetical protein